MRIWAKCLSGLVLSELQTRGGVVTEIPNEDELISVLSNYCFNTTDNTESESNYNDDVCLILSIEDKTLLEVVIQMMTKLEAQRRPRILLLSTLMTWAGRSYTAIIGDCAGEFAERIPASCAVESYMLENSLWSLANCSQPLGALKVAILSSCLVYGNTGGDVSSQFRAIWDNDSALSLKVLPSLSGGKNRVPMIHESDFARLVAALVYAIDDLPSPNFFPASDCSNKSLIDLFNDVYVAINGSELDSSFVCLSETDVLDQIISNTSETFPRSLLWNVDMAFANECLQPCSDAVSQGLCAGSGLQSTWAEFLAAHFLLPVSAALAGTPAAGKTEVSKLLAKMCVFILLIQSLILFLKFMVLKLINVYYKYRLNAEYITISKAVMFVLTGALAPEFGDLKLEVVGVLEAKILETKRAAAKKGEEVAPTPLDPATIDLNESLMSSLSSLLLQRCLFAMTRCHSVCMRRGYVMDVWGDSVRSPSDYFEATSGRRVEGAGVAVEEAKEEGGEAGGTQARTQGPEVFAELQVG